MPNAMQQQRVALARTLAYRPRLLLLDEPLSNLDAKLRDRARSWLKQLQSQVGITTIFVTHDQTEALSLSDHIAVMNNGEVVQFGSPTDIYQRPATPFVADFIGSSNFFDGVVEENSASATVVKLADGHRIMAQPAPSLQKDQPATVVCRPERIIVRESGANGSNVLQARVVERNYLGARNVFTLQAGQDTFRIEKVDEIGHESVSVELPEEHCVVFARSDKSAGNRSTGGI